MATLYEMTDAARQLYAMLQEEEIDEQVMTDTLEGMGAEEKVESYCKLVKQFTADAEMFKDEKDRLAARQKAAENAVDRLKGALLEYMLASGQEKIKAGTFAVATAKTQAVNVLDEAAIPEQYLKPQPPKIDKAEISKALKAGETVEGAELITNIGVRIR